MNSLTWTALQFSVVDGLGRTARSTATRIHCYVYVEDECSMNLLKWQSAITRLQRILPVYISKLD